MEIGGKSYVLPVKSMILTQVIPTGDSAVKFSIRRTLFDETYQNYQVAAAQ